MPTIKIGNHRVSVDDTFMSLSEEEQGRTVDEIASQLPKAGAFEDYGKSVLSGVSDGVSGILGMPGDIISGLHSVADWGARKVGDALGLEPAKPEDMPQSPWWSAQNIASLFGSDDFKGAAAQIAPGWADWQPERSGSRFAKAGTAGVTSAAAFGGGLGGAVRYGLAPALAGEGVYQMMEGGPLDQYKDAGRMAAGLATAIAPSVAHRYLSGGRVPDAKTQILHKKFEQEGVPVSNNQYRGIPGTKSMDQKMNPAAAADFNDRQLSAFTKAAIKKTGVDVDDLSPANIQKIDDVLGRKFDAALIPGSSIPPDRALAKRLIEIGKDYQLDAANPIGRIQKTISDLVGFIRKGKPIPVERYQSTRQQLGRIMRAAKGDYPTIEAAGALTNALDEAYGEVLKAINPKALGLHAEARRQWRNFLVLRRAASYSNSATARGMVNAQNIESAVKSVEGANAKVFGTSDFDDLYRGGRQFMQPFPDAGTANNLASMVGGRLGGMMSGGGAIGAAFGGGLPGAIAGAGLGMAGDAALRLAGRGMLSDAGMQWLKADNPITRQILATMAAQNAMRQ